MNTSYPDSLSDIQSRLAGLFKRVKRDDLLNEFDSEENFAIFVNRCTDALYQEFGFRVDKLFQDDRDAIFRIAYYSEPFERINIIISRVYEQYKIDIRILQR